MQLNPAPSRDELIGTIISTVVEAVNLQHVDRKTIGAETALTQGGLELDSVDILEIVVTVEHRFGVKVGDPETGKKYFRTIGTIADLVELRAASRGAPQSTQ